MNEKKQYIVQIPGKEHVAYWDEDTYAANQEKLYSDYPNAEVTSMSIADPYGDMQDNDQFAVVIPGKEHVAQWDAKTLAANRDKLLQDFGNAQVYRLNNETLQRDMDFIQQYDDATSVFSVENSRFVHDNADRYKSLMEKYSQPQEEQEEPKQKASWNPFRGRREAYMRFLGEGMNLFAEGVRALRIARTGDITADDTLWKDANEEYERRIAAGEPLFQNNVGPSTADKAAMSWDERRAAKRQESVNYLINRLQKKAEEAGENPEESVRNTLARGAETSDVQVIQDAASRIIENNSTPMKGLGKVGAMAPLIGSSIASVALAASGNLPAAKAMGELTIAGFTSSAASSAMKQARDAGATTEETGLAGIATAMIFSLFSKIPINRAIGNAFSSSAAKAATTQALTTGSQNIEREMELLVADAAKNGLFIKGTEQEAKKILAKEFLSNWGKQAAVNTASFATMSAAQAMVPLIYEDPEKYPALSSVLNAAKEGAVDALILTAFTGGFTSGAELANRMQRWKGRGVANIAEVRFNSENPPEVFEYNPRTNKWDKPSKVNSGTNYFADVVELGPDSAKALINDGGRMKMVSLRTDDVLAFRQVDLNKAQTEAKEAYREQGYEQGRQAETSEQRENISTEQKYITEKASREAQAGGVTEGTQLDLDKANAAMEGRREAVRDQIQQRTGQQFWKTENISVPSEDGQAMMLQQENVVDAVTLADGRQIFIVGEDETSLAYVDETGANRLIDKNSQEIVSRQRYTLDEYLDGRVQAQDAEAEQQRMQAEQAQNLADMQQRLQEQGGRINLGTPEQENWVPIVNIDGNPNGGIAVLPEGAKEPIIYPWKQVASILGMPYEGRTGDELVQERLNQDQKVDNYNKIPQGAELQVPIDGGDVQIYKFRSAEVVDGEIIIRADDPESGQTVELTPDIINNLEALQNNHGGITLNGVQYGPVEYTVQAKRGTVEVRTKSEQKDGLTVTTAVALRNGEEVSMPNSHFPMPEGYSISQDDYESIFQDQDGNPLNVELLGVHQIREGDNGAGMYAIGATIVVKDETGVTTYDVKLTKDGSIASSPEAPAVTEIYNDPAANQLGLSKDYAYTAKNGQVVVNGNALWADNPRLWAQWNDLNENRAVPTKTFLEAKLKTVNAEVDKARTALEMEATGRQDPQAMIDLKEKLTEKQRRQAEVQTLYNEYDAAEKALIAQQEAEAKAAKEAEDAAKAAAFQAQIEAQRQERERKEAEHQVLMSQDEAFRARTEEYQQAKKYVGRATKVNVGGEQYPAHFVLMEAGTPLTSHDPLNNFTPTEGFGVDEQGRNLNTRAYDKEAEEQEGARAIGRHPDYRLIEYMPVVTYEGRAVSGNKRLSGRKLAAADGTDTDLIKEYNDAREQFDFTEEQLAEFEHPVVVKQLDEPVPYTAKFFDAFNQSIGTAASTVALAAKVAKMTDDVLVNRVANLFLGVDDIQKVYQNPETVKQLFNILEAEKISPREDRPRYIDAEGKLTGAGEDFVESLLFGSIFSESDDAVRQAMADKSIRRAVAFAFPTLVRVRNLGGDYSIIGEMTDAVTILAQAKADNQGKPEGAIEYYLLQPDLFTGETPVVAATTQLLAQVLNDKKYGSLRKVLDQYIGRAELANEGQLGFNFDGGEGIRETKEDILKDVLKNNNIDIRTYGNTGQITTEPAAGGELPANDEVYPPSGEYGGGRAEIERPAAESAGGLQAEGNTAAEVAPASANLPRYNLGQSDISKLWLEHEASKEVDKGKPGRKEIVQAIYDANAELNSFRNENQRLDKIADVVELAMTYPDLAISQEVLKRVDANDTALGSLFSMLGTSRKQAPLDRLQDKMTDIDRRVKENPADKDALMNEKAEAIKEFIETEKTVEGANLHATSIANLPEVMKANGEDDRLTGLAVSAIKANMAIGIRPRSFATRSGHTYILADNVRDVKDAQTAHIHEEEHIVTSANGDHIKLLGMEGASRNGFLNAIDGWVGYIPAYHGLSDEGVANEFISHAIERTYGLPEEEVAETLNKAGVDSEEIINLVKNRNNGRTDRLRRPLPETRRRGSEVLHAAGQEDAGQDGGNIQEGSRGNLERQGSGSGTPSRGGAEGGEAESATAGESGTTFSLEKNGTDNEQRRATQGQVRDRGNAGRVSEQASRTVAIQNDRGRIRVLEAEVASPRTEYSSDSSGDYARRLDQDAEGRRIVEAAKQNGLFIEPGTFSNLPKSPQPSKESFVYMDRANNRVIKVKNPFAIEGMTDNSPFDELYQHIIHNIYFPESKYEFLGVTTNARGDEVRFVLGQEFIESMDRVGDVEAIQFVKGHGFTPIDGYWYENDDVKVSDFYGSNILKDADGNLHLIDPIIAFKRDPRAIIDDMLKLERKIEAREPKYSPEKAMELRIADLSGSPQTEVISEIGKNTTEGTVMFSLDKDEKSLVGIHNISADKLGKALRMGGLANPSAAVIDIARQNHFGYGDISLVMPSSLVDKSSGHNIGTFDRDAWTPTYPRIKYFESKQSRQRLNELIKDLPSELQYTLRYKVENYLNGDVYNSGLEYLFLKEKGMEIGMQRTPRKYPNASEKEFMTDYLKNPNLSWNGSHGSEIMDAYRALTPDERLSANLYMNQHGNADGIELIKQRIEKWPQLKERYEKERSYAEVDSFLYGLVVDQRDAGKESTGLTIEKAIEVIKQNGLEEEFGFWQDKVIDALGFDEKFYDHTTYDGTKKYKAHTLENVSAWMKKQGRNASSDHGLVMTSGTLMAKMAQKFNSLAQIRRAKGRLVPMGEEGKDYNAKIDDVKERIKNLVCSFWSDKLSRQSGLLTGELVALDYVQDFLILGKDLDSVVENYNATEHESLSLTDEEKAAFNTLREDIRNLPVHYFETKFERPVYLNEFSAAVVPADSPADIKKALRDNGLKLIEYDRESDGDRRRAMLEASEEDGVRFSFIGEIGAERLDAAQGREDRMNDLFFARNMEASGRDAKTIKLATGWEKGLDGKWRYEKHDFKEYDPDGNIEFKKRNPELERYEELLGKSNKYLFFPENHEPLTEAEQAEFNRLSPVWQRKPGDWTGKGWKTPYHNSSKLPDYIDDEELFQAYPEFREVKVKFEDMQDDTGGYFAEAKNTIVMNSKDRYLRERASDILVHEIQHMIQAREGFSEGTNLEEAENKARTAKPKRNLLDKNQKEFVDSVQTWFNSSASWKMSVPLKSYIGQVASRIGEDYYNKNLEGKTSDDLLREYNRLIILRNSAQPLTPIEIYAATSGEVEARNVETRRRIGFQNPRAVLAEETEDIARKDQILNMPTYGLLDVDGLTESLKTAQQKTNKVPGSKAMSIELDDDVNLMQTTDNQAAKDLASRYDNQDGDKYPWMSEGELIDAIEKELPYGKDTKPVFALIDEYRRLDKEDFEEGRRDFSGGEKQDLFENILSQLRTLGESPETVMFSLTKNNRATIESWLKKRSDLKEEDRNAVMEYLEELNDSKTQLAAAKWFTKGTIRLPEDMPKVEQAISVAGKAKVDPLKYDSPMALLDAHADFKPTEKRINPDEVKTLHKVKAFPDHGIVIYDVDDSEESRQNMRKIINTHFGKDASPWCLLQGDGEGNLTEDSKYYWGVYNAYPKQAAFKDGKLLSFSASDDKEVTWWDRQDAPHGGIPVDRKIPNDDLGRSATYELDADGLLANPTNIHKGNKQNGAYTEWFGLGEDNISKEENYLNGKKHGKSVAYRANGLVKAEEYYENGEPVGEQVWYYDNGNLESKGVYDRKGRLLRSESFFTNGQIKLLINYQDGKRHGLTKEWYDNGNPFHSSYWVNGQREGVHEAYFKDGKLRERSEYKNGKLNGVEEDWNEKGILIARIEYKDGQRHGKVKLYYNGGQPYEEKDYTEGVANGIYRHWNANGILTNEFHYKDNRPDGLQKRFWSDTGKPLEFSNYKDGLENGVTKVWGKNGELQFMALMENGRNVRDLLAEGVTEEDADSLNFSFVTDEKELQRLEKEPTITLYRAMAQIDGKLYPPMSTKEPNGPGQRGQKLKLRQPSELGRWERADEAPDKAKQGKDGKWYFDLKKGNGGDINGVLYNPYFHTSASPLNDQFSGAINYPELVTVEVEVPMSEFGSGYRAEKAADTVGPKDWHSGTVTGQLGEGRQVVLTRWAKPVRIVPDSEVAAIVAPKLIEKGISVPSNVVTPSLKAELEKRGVGFDGVTKAKQVKAKEQLDRDYLSAVDAGDMEKASEMLAKAARKAFPESAVVDEFYTPKVVLHGTKSEFRAFDPDKIGSANDNGWLGRGFYFYGNNPTYASQYANFNNPKGGKVIKAFLNIENPYWASVEDFQRLAEQNSQEASEEFTRSLKEEGYDGVYYNGDGNEEWVAFYPNQIKSAETVTYDNHGNVIPLSERFNPKKDDIYFSLTNENQEIFVSNAAKAVEGIKNDKATPEQWLKQLEKNGGLKAGEDKWIGLSDWLKSQDRKSLTKQEVLDYINEHRIQIEEVHYLENNPKVDEALEKYNREMRSYMQDPDELYEYADRQLADFYLEMEEKYGENYLYEMTESEQAAENQLLQARDDASNLEPEEEAFRQMVNKYGDDFEQAFSLDGDELEINTGFDGEPDPEAMHFLELEGASERPINDTRLEYTTPGLDNKHEIVLTVPTIEPWDTSDNVHFGDAGEGRAIAWIRFGETKAEIGNSKEWEEYKRLRNSYGEARHAVETSIPGMGDKQAREELEVAEKNLAEFEQAHPNAGNTHYGRVLVIDEIQSKRHQEGREKGYRADKETLDKIENAYMDADMLYRTTLSRLADKYKNFAPKGDEISVHKEVLSEVDSRGLQDVETARKTALEEYKKHFDDYGYPRKAPQAPFEKNWHELAMKRMLRYAAENGYDYIAWTTGDQQAERYSLSKAISGIGVDEFASSDPEKAGWREVFLHRDNARNIDLQVDGEGVVRPGSDMFVGEKLSDVVGKDIAVKIMSADVSNGMVELDETAMKVGGAGMKGFYDDILPRFMNKYGKKWGVSVKDMFIPGIGETMNGLTMHGVEVTDEMKVSVMEGQPMFSMVQDDKLPVQGELFGEDNEPVRYESLGGLPKGEGRNSIVERTFRKSKAFSFTGKEKIESAADVAYIFKELEDSAVENAFLVFVKDGVPTIIHAGIGNISSVGIDTAPLLVGIKDFAPDRIYMVHNHPSGRVEASAADITELHRIAEAAEGVPVEGIIIDTISGEYGQFDDTVMGRTAVDTRPSDNEQQNAVPLDVLTFDKMVFSPDYWKEINSQNPITGAKDVAEYISAHRLGESSKINALLLDRQNKVVGNLVLNTNVLSKDNAREQARHIVDAANRSAASAVIVNGDFKFDKATIFTIKNGIDTYGVGKVSFMDMVKVDGMHTQSLMEGTLRDATDIEPTIQGLKKAERTIGEWLSNNARNRSITITLPEIIKRRIDRIFGRQIGDNVITANNVIHAKNNHGVNGSKITENSIPLRDSDFELMPDIMVAPDMIEKGSLDASGRESIRFIKNLSNGYAVVVEKEQKNSPDDLETITMWAEKSSRVADARSRKRPLQSTSEPTTVADGTNVVTVISDSDIAKIRKDAEKAIGNADNVLQDSFERAETVQTVAESGKSGFAKVIGEDNLEPLYNKIYRAIPKEILKPIVGDAVNDGLQIRKYLDRYLHDLAKNGTENDETGLLGAIYSEVRAYTGNPALTDGDIRYMLWKATSEAKDGDMLSLIEDLAMRRRWGAGEDEPMFSMSKDFADATDEAREKLDERLEGADAAAKEAAKTLRKETMDAIRNREEGESFKSKMLPISKAMTIQKQYDKKTVDGIVKFAKEILKNGNVDSLTYRETNRLLALVNSANGKSPVYATRYSEQLLDLLLDHIVKKEAGDFNALVNIKDKTTNQKGVETLGKLDLRGQETMKAFRDSRKLTEKEMEDRLLDISERMDDPSDAVRAHAIAEYEGVMLAQEYQAGLGENLKEADDLERELEYEKEARKTGNIDKKAYDEYVRSTKEAIRENKMERVDLYRDFGKRLADIASEGSARAKAFREANKLRIEAIHHDANRDMKGISTKEHRSDSRIDRLINSDAIRFLFKPLATFDQMLRVIGRRNMSGEGYLWNRFMRGWVDAAEQSYSGLFAATDELDKKASEVFGKKMRWSEIYEIERRMPKATVRFMDGGDLVEHELTAGNLLYIYMVDKMVDGRMKLRKMGIDEAMVQEIKNNLDPRFIELADWVQEDFLVRKRNKYNEVHERMFGAPMADIQDYFPLKILANARVEEVDLGSRPDGSPLSSTTTGSIIKRRKNSLALDLLHTDAFSLVIEHLQQMEDWAAFAEYRRDLNSLLSYKRFRNQLQNMRTIYGTGKALWGNFKDVASMASGSYKPKVGKGDVDTVVLNISKGVTAAKINFRVNTALKQLLSAPAYLPEVNIGDLAKSLAKPGASWNWCMENLPVFKKRWKSHLAGDTRLMDTESDWEIWRRNAVKTAGRLGMVPNAFVDAATVAIGAKAMYDTKYRRYIESGYSETAADRRAKQDATILYNQTQQSNENPFVSPMQLDRTMLSVMLTTFRNASMGYQRQLHDAIRGLGREFDDMPRQDRIDFMAEQAKNAGADEEQAKAGAEKEYGRQKWRNLARIAIFGFGLQFLWNLGADIWYEIFGDDEKKKKKTLENAALKTLAGPIEGLAGGNIASDAWGTISSGQSLRNIGFGELPIVSDAKTILQEMEYDQPAAVNDIINLVAQSATGVNPETITDIAVAVIDACNGDLGTAKEVALLMMRIAQIPQSTIDEFYIDEVGMNAKKAKRLNPSELAKRYAEYKMNKTAPMTQGLYDEKTEKRRLKTYEKRFKDKAKERNK